MENDRTLSGFEKFKRYLTMKTSMINHQEIIMEVSSGVEHSWIYYLMLIMAGLIALLGLLTNSVSVVIGAMLISPLMGPIISSGLALATGDLPLARKAFRTIAVSILIIIMITAVLTTLSPLKEPTSEILARVRPNIYDLFVAVLSGIVGAVALCTKRNYMITATGVAVATAVIPPLSVAGYGIGTGRIMLGFGGFLLFFTNFVAIILTSYIVFFVMGFRTAHVETIQYSQRTRLLVIWLVLSVVSVPLIHTLFVDIQKVNTKKRIERVLKKHLNMETSSRMTGFSYRQDKNLLFVRATVNTVGYIDKDIRRKIEEDLVSGNNGSKVSLHIEQVIVASDKLPVNNLEELAVNAVIPKPHEESLSELENRVSQMISKVETELQETLSPFPVYDTRITFSKSGKPIDLKCSLKRDYPATDEEQQILSRLLERTMQVPVSVAITTTPLFSKVSITREGKIKPENIKELEIIKRFASDYGSFQIVLEASEKYDGKAVSVIFNYLVKNLEVPEKIIRIIRLKGSRKILPESRGVTLRIIRHKK